MPAGCCTAVGSRSFTGRAQSSTRGSWASATRCMRSSSALSATASALTRPRGGSPSIGSRELGNFRRGVRYCCRVFARGAMVIAILVLGACGSSTPTAHTSPTISSAPVTASATASSTSSTTGPGPTTLVHCGTPVPAGDNLVIGTVVGDPTVVVRDIQDPANAKNLCTFDSAAQAPVFVNGGAVAYETASR